MYFGDARPGMNVGFGFVDGCGWEEE